MGKTVFLGVEGSGKTTLMMALAKEFERQGRWLLSEAVEPRLVPLSQDAAGKDRRRDLSASDGLAS